VVTVRHATRAILCAGIVSGLLGGCSLITDSFLTNDFSGDPYPVNVETESGAIIVGMRTAADPTPHVAVLDLLSPFTVIAQPPDAPLSVSYVDITLLGKGPSSDLLGGPIDLSATRPRARFPEVQVISLHPCDPAAATCDVGPTGARAFEGIIGADALAGDAVRLRLGDHQLFVLPDTGGSDRGRSLDCDAVFDSPFRGGGTLVIAGTELPFGNRRITLQACLGPDPDRTKPQDRRGADALFVLSTSIGTSILDETAYQRYALAHPGVPELATLPVDTVYLPSGPIHGHRGNVNGLALVATSTSNALAPCRQVYAHHLLTTYAVDDRACQGKAPTVDCPCENGNGFCSVPAILELTPPAGVDVLVVADIEPTLQALRTELRPDQPEVDGILGTDVLRVAEIDVDYPHDRLIARCPGGNCSARPELAQQDDLCQINRCITGAEDARGCSPDRCRVTPDPATCLLDPTLP
jgi:hypothetical protein